MVDMKTLLEQSRAKQAADKLQTISPPVKENEGQKEPAKKENPFANLAKKTKQIAAATNVKQVEKTQADAAVSVNPVDIEAAGAKQFQSDDQPDKFNEEVVAELRSSFEVLHQGFEDRELISEALKNIMLLIRRHEFLKDMLLPEDCQIMVRALRESYGKVITIKDNRSKKQQKVQKEVSEVMKDLDGLDIQI